MSGFTNGSYSAGYSYLANSALMGQVTFKDETTTRMTTSKTYDYLNRLLTTASTSTGPVSSHSYQYNDANQRTRVDLVDGSYWVYEYDKLGQVTSGKRYWADGTTNNNLVRGFTWGLDLSGSVEGAGGIGGLLMFTDTATSTTHFTTYDGNGNVIALVKASDGSKTADYEYSPFGEVIRASGSGANSNPFRFSTKYQDDATDLLYYGYRFYNASTGRWVSRDLIRESGGLNLQAFVQNDCIGNLDSLGLVIQRGYEVSISNEG